MVRPRGWHLVEKHATIDGKIVGGAFFDFGLYFFHNAKALLARGSGPYFYLPKTESHLEARLWNDIFNFAQDELGVPGGAIKATVLIETILAAFEMDEILYELREHSAGLNIGRWDYIFSCIKKFRSNKDFCLADRAQVTMTSPFMRAYALLLVKTCHRRNAHAMGGMAAQIPIKNDAAANEAAIEKVRADKEREATDGCDGTWVAHPGLVPIAKAIFDKHMPTPNQVHRKRDDVNVTAKDLLDFRPEKPITETGLRMNINVSLQYLGSWLAGTGCVPIFNLMEDAATAEISRCADLAVDSQPKGRAGRRSQGHRRAVSGAAAGRTRQGAQATRRAAVRARRPLRGSREDARRDRHVAKTTSSSSRSRRTIASTDRQSRRHDGPASRGRSSAAVQQALRGRLPVQPVRRAPHAEGLHSDPRRLSAGRLDADSEGLLVLTDDGALQHRISHPRHKLPKTYWVQVEGVPTPVALCPSARRHRARRLGCAARHRCARSTSRPDCGQRNPPIRLRRRFPPLARDHPRGRQEPSGAAHDGCDRAADPAPGSLARRQRGPWRTSHRANGARSRSGIAPRKLRVPSFRASFPPRRMPTLPGPLA